MELPNGVTSSREALNELRSFDFALESVASSLAVINTCH